jgi:hydrogenase nickel incorporation protein HypB
MCEHCGCGNTARASVLNLQTGKYTVIEHEAPESIHHHHHDHPHDHENHHGHVENHGRQHEHHHKHGHQHHHDHVGHSSGTDNHGHQHEHHHEHGHQHLHGDASHALDVLADPGADHRHKSPSVVTLEARILAKNDALAAKNRTWFADWDILALNLVSSPGAGKTTLLERTIGDLKAELKLFVVEGDQSTANDGQRIRAAGAPVVQVNTGTGCHLEADMVARGLSELNPGRGSIVMIENVGNLVCPALFDLGERAKVVILSVTEGEDKPLKYPHMFRAAEVMVLNKIDLLPHVEFDMERAAAHARQVNPDIIIVPLSARTGQGLDAWYGWIRHELALTREAALR